MLKNGLTGEKKMFLLISLANNQLSEVQFHFSQSEASAHLPTVHWLVTLVRVKGQDAIVSWTSDEG